MPESRVSRELHAAVWSIDLGMREGKPKQLARAHFLGGADRVTGEGRTFNAPIILSLHQLHL